MFAAILIIPIFVMLFTFPVLRLFNCVTDIIVGIITLIFPAWYVRDWGGKVLPYYFNPEYDN